ncbi:MAG: hypothetical protein ABH952_01055 [Candidatus Omnitrophota bacterium]
MEILTGMDLPHVLQKGAMFDTMFFWQVIHNQCSLGGEIKHLHPAQVNG